MLIENSTKAKRRAAIFRYAPLVIWIGVIFLLSSSEGSMAQTSRFIRPLLEFLFPAADEATLQVYHGYIRKAAHVTEYAVLAVLAARALAASAKPLLKNYRWLAAIFLVFAVAAADEFNQGFNPSRTGTPWDVALDLAGGVLGICVFAALGRR